LSSRPPEKAFELATDSNTEIVIQGSSYDLLSVFSVNFNNPPYSPARNLTLRAENGFASPVNITCSNCATPDIMMTFRNSGTNVLTFRDLIFSPLSGLSPLYTTASSVALERIWVEPVVKPSAVSRGFFIEYAPFADIVDSTFKTSLPAYVSTTNAFSGMARITNCSFSGGANTGDIMLDGGVGGALFISDSRSIIIENSTFSNSMAKAVGGAFLHLINTSVR
jgi:hypothetical protein